MLILLEYSLWAVVPGIAQWKLTSTMTCYIAADSKFVTWFDAKEETMDTFFTKSHKHLFFDSTSSFSTSLIRRKMWGGVLFGWWSKYSFFHKPMSTLKIDIYFLLASKTFETNFFNLHMTIHRTSQELISLLFLRFSWLKIESWPAVNHSFILSGILVRRKVHYIIAQLKYVLYYVFFF